MAMVEAFKLKKVPKPKEIKQYLDEYIIGQDERNAILLWLFITIISVYNSQRMMMV